MLYRLLDSLHKVVHLVPTTNAFKKVETSTSCSQKCQLSSNQDYTSIPVISGKGDASEHFEEFLSARPGDRFWI